MRQGSSGTKRTRTGWAIVALIAVTGCGGAVNTGPGPSGDGGPGTDGAPGSDSAPPTDSGPQPDGTPGRDSGPGAQCPGTPPPQGGACTSSGLECEYGTSNDPNCNTLFACSAAGTWQDMSSSGICLPPDAGAACPATYAAVPVGKVCSPNTLECAYTQGTCLCTNSMGGPVMINSQWDCIAATPTCPSPRPRLGSPCTEPSQMCDYGACAGGVSLICMNGYWSQQQVACAQ